VVDRFDITMLDVGGSKGMRDGVWAGKYPSVHAVVFVVDAAASSERLVEAKLELKKLAAHPLCVGKPVLVYANKQDLPGALDESAIAQGLGLNEGGLSGVEFTVVKCTANLKARPPTRLEFAAPPTMRFTAPQMWKKKTNTRRVFHYTSLVIANSKVQIENSLSESGCCLGHHAGERRDAGPRPQGRAAVDRRRHVEAALRAAGEGCERQGRRGGAPEEGD